MSRVLLAVSFLVLPLATVPAATLEVDPTGNGDHTTIQDAIWAAADGDVILVHPGVYREHVSLIAKHVVIGSLYYATGDTGYVPLTVIDAEDGGHAVTIRDVGEAAQLAGLTIRNGYHNDGGGLNCVDASPRLDRLVIEDCGAYYDGGGIYLENSASLITDVRVEDCTTGNHTHAHGSGIHCEDSSPTLRRVVVVRCRGAGSTGGGINCAGTSAPTLEDCVIADNEGGWGGGIYGSPTIVGGAISGNRATNGMGGGIYGSPHVEGTIISGNTARDGGGGVYGSPVLEGVSILDNRANFAGGGVALVGAQEGDPVPRITDAIIQGNYVPNYFNAGGGGGVAVMGGKAVLERVVISGNRAMGLYDGGGGIMCDGSSPVLVNVTIADNTASDNWQYPGGGGGIFCDNSAHPRLINSIVWNNAPGQVVFHSYHAPDTITVAYSDIQNGESGISTGNNGLRRWLEGNMANDPQFANPSVRDYSLSTGSPCIDAGVALYSDGGEILVDYDPGQYEGTAPDMGGLEGDYWSGDPWPSQAGPCIVVKVVTDSGEDSVGRVDLSMVPAKSDDGGPGPAVRALRADVMNGFAIFDAATLGAYFSGPNIVERLELYDRQATPALVGHIGFKYIGSDYFTDDRKVEAYVFLHDDEPAMDEDHPYHDSHFEEGWDYYETGEHPVSMLVPPGGDHLLAQGGAQRAVVFVHGVAGIFNYWEDTPELLDGQLYDAWRFVYPYDQAIEESGRLLGQAVGRLIDGDLDGVWAYHPRDVSLVAHSMGGLVSRSYIQGESYIPGSVDRLLMFATPNHGSHVSYKLRHTPWAPGHIADLDLITNHDRDAPAHQDMTPGSDFLLSLNAQTPRGLGTGVLADDYLVLAGHDDIYALAHREIENQDDGVVAASSASLLGFGIPLALVDQDHRYIHKRAESAHVASIFLGDYDHAEPGFSSWVDCMTLGLGQSPCGSDHGVDTGAGMLQLRITNARSSTDHYRVREGPAGFIDFVENDGGFIYDRLIRAEDDEDGFFSQRYRFADYDELGLWWSEGTFHVRIVHDDDVVASIRNAFRFDHMATEVATLTLPPAGAMAAAAPNGHDLSPGVMSSISYPFTVDAGIDSLVFSLSDVDNPGGLATHAMELVTPGGITITEFDYQAHPGLDFAADAELGPVQYVLRDPEDGLWTVRHDESVPSPRVRVYYYAGTRAELDITAGHHAAGDTLSCDVTLVGIDGCATSETVLACRWTSLDGETEVEMGPVSLAPNGLDRLEGDVVAVTPGVYKLDLTFTCEPVAGDPVVRRAERRVWIGGSADDELSLDPGEDIEPGAPPRLAAIVGVHPNPFNPQLKIAYDVPRPGRATLSVYDLKGRLVKVLRNEPVTAGRHHSIWTGTDASDRSAPSGVYLIRLRVDDAVVTRKAMLLK